MNSAHANSGEFKNEPARSLGEPGAGATEFKNKSKIQIIINAKIKTQ